MRRADYVICDYANLNFVVENFWINAKGKMCNGLFNEETKRPDLMTFMV